MFDVIEALLRPRSILPTESEGDLKGFIESAVRSSNLVKITGWAAHLGSGGPCVAVLILQNDSCLAVGHIDIERPDVTEHLGDKAGPCGFEVQCYLGEGPLKILVVLISGEVSDISELAGSETKRVLNGLTA